LEKEPQIDGRLLGISGLDGLKDELGLQPFVL
jgi:hypothetical protein